LRTAHVEIDLAAARDPPQHPLPQILETMACGGIERAVALAAVVVALERVIEPVLRAAE